MQTIKVTQEHIERGAACSSTDCPIALAILEQTDLTQINVDYDAVSHYGAEGTHHTTRLPIVATQFINFFDAKGEGVDAEFGIREPVKPFEFELNVEALR